MPQQAGRAPGLPPSPQVTRTAQGRREEFTPRQRREARGSTGPFQGTGQLRRAPLSVPEPAVPGLAANPALGGTAASPPARPLAQPLGSPGLRGRRSWRYSAEQGAGATQLSPPQPAPAGPEPPTEGSRMCLPRAEGTTGGSPGSRLRCRQLGPRPCPS